MKQKNIVIPDSKQLKKALGNFYHKPIAQVSTELFLSIAAVVFFALSAIRPTILTMTDLIKEIQDKRKTSEALSKKIAALSTVQTEYFVLQDKLYIFDQTVPSEPHLMHVIKMIEKIASENQVMITSLQSKNITQKPEKEYDFQQKKAITENIIIGITGEYEQMRNFIQSLTETRPLMTLESVVFSETERRDETELKATISVNFHYFGREVLESKK